MPNLEINQIISEVTENGLTDTAVVNGTSSKLHLHPQQLGFETRTIHDGQDPLQWNSRAVIPPISMATTFQQEAPGKHAVTIYQI